GGGFSSEVQDARIEVAHARTAEATGGNFACVSARLRPFVLGLMETPQIDNPILPSAHLGGGCTSRDEVDRLCEQARGEGRLRFGPTDSGYPVGYWAFIADPDEHTLEVSFGQEVALTVKHAQ